MPDVPRNREGASVGVIMFEDWREAKSWDGFPWPDWVPPEVRKEIERFWSPAQKRTPGEWLKSAESPYSYSPPFGELTTLPGDRGRPVTGRWIHCWNSMGRLVHEDGSYTVASGNPSRKQGGALCHFCSLPPSKENPIVGLGKGYFHTQCLKAESEAARKAIYDLGRFLKLVDMTQ